MAINFCHGISRRIFKNKNVNRVSFDNVWLFLTSGHSLKTAFNLNATSFKKFPVEIQKWFKNFSLLYNFCMKFYYLRLVKNFTINFLTEHLFLLADESPFFDFFQYFVIKSVDLSNKFWVMSWMNRDETLKLAIIMTTAKKKIF